MQEFAGLGIHRHHLSGFQAALADHVFGFVIIDADFRGQSDVAVFGDHPARWTQTVSVHGAGGVAAIGHDDAGRAVPGFHMHGVVFIEGAQIGIHGVDVLPGWWNQQAHGAENIHAAGEQGFEHIIQTVGVGPAHGHQRTHILHRDMR